jgi:Protein kinase domain
MIGRNIGTYQIVEKLGEGGLGTVYRAVDHAAQRDAAIEILRPEYSENADLTSRLRSESAALSRLVHPAIATCYGFFQEGDDGFLFTEFVPGETLEDRLQRVGGLPWQQASDLVLQALDGLKQAHETNILHGDMKPANIMLTPEARVKVKSFGIARMLNQVSPEYLAPECVLGKPADGRSDLYSLGLVFYQMLTGRRAFQGEDSAALLRAHVEEAPKLPSELGIQIPQPIEQALMRALAKNPEYRYADAAAFTAQLRGAVGSVGMGQAPAAAPLPGVAPAPVAAVAPAVAPALANPPAAAPVIAPKGPTPPAKAPVAQKGGSKKGLWMSLAGAVVLIGGSAGGYFAFKDRWKPQPKPVTQAEPAPQLAPAPDPMPAPVTETQPPPSEPVSTAPTTPPVETPSTAAAGPVNRAAVVAALEQTDGPVPVGAVAGSRPLHYTGVLKAARIAGSGPIIVEAVQKRGVNFQLSTKQRFDLRVAGAQDPLIRVLPGAYRAGTAVASSAPPPSTSPTPTTITDPAPPPAPPPPSSSNSPSPSSSPASTSVPPAAPLGPPLQHLREIHKIMVLSKEPALDEDLKQAIKTEFGSRVEVVRSAALADAVLRIEVAEDQTGKVGRAFGMKNKHKAVAQVVEKRQNHVLWTTEAGDRQDMSGEGGRRIASRIAKQLRKDWEK